MNARRLYLLLLGLTLAASAPAADENVSKGSRIIARLASSPLDWKLPVEGTDFEVVESPEGVTFLLKSDPLIPMLQMRCCVRAGALFEQGGKPQLARVTSRMLRESGSPTMTVEKIDSLLEYYSGELEITCGKDLVWLDGSMLSRHGATLVEILASVLSRPAFTKDKLDYTIRRLQQEEQAAAEDPFYLCGRKFYGLLYQNHPYGSLFSSEGLDQVTLEEVVEFHKRFYFPQNIWVVVTGDFKKSDLLGKWSDFYHSAPPKRDLLIPAVPEPRFRPGVFLVQKNINQSSIYFGLQASTKADPDIHRIHLLNHMVGGSSFASRFTQQVRDREGLAYRVDSLMDTELLARGAFVARCRTKTESTERAIDAMQWCLDLFREAKFTDTEFQAGKSGLKNGFVKGFATVADVLTNFLMLRILDRPRQYLEEYQDRVETITHDQLQETARRLLDRSRMTYVIVGNVRSIESALKKFGEVTYLPATGPLPALEPPSPAK